MKLPPEKLYELLPAYLRNRDFGEGQPLRALMAVLESEYRQLHQATASLYGDWFVETCDDERLPRIGDLVGLRGLTPIPGGPYSARAWVADTLAFRRHKGIAAILGKAASAATGWGARVLGTASQSEDSRVADASPPAVADLELRLWRLESYPVQLAAARRVGLRRYTFNPFGLDIHLFNRPREPASLVTAASDEDIAAPLERQPLAAEIEARRAGDSPTTSYFGSEPVLQVFFTSGAVPAEAISICDLSAWQQPAANATYRKVVGGQEQQCPILVAVDPVLGRLTLPADQQDQELRVSYSYGFSGDYGGGPYPRGEKLTPPTGDHWQAVVWRPSRGDPRRVTAESTRMCFFKSLHEALRTWNSASACEGHIRILDNSLYEPGGLPFQIRLDGRRRLVIEAADGKCPALQGDLLVRGAAPYVPPAPHCDPAPPSTGTTATPSLRLSGLWIDGKVELEGDVSLELVDTTLEPPDATDPCQPSVRGKSSGCRLRAESSILGPIRLSPYCPGIELVDTIVDAGLEQVDRFRYALAGVGSTATSVRMGPPAAFERCTILGRSALIELRQAIDTLFVEAVIVGRHHEGEVRYSYIAPRSRVPPPFNSVSPTADQGSLQLGVADFTSVRYGASGYAQLTCQSPQLIRTGGSDGAEIGAFHDLHQPQRAAHLPEVLADYVRWPLKCRYIFVT